MKHLDKRIPFTEVLHPSESEFRDFRAYVNKLSQSPRYANASLLKIIPPKSFASESLYKSEMLDRLEVVSPIEQQVFSKGELCELRLVGKRSMKLRDYKNLVDADEKISELSKNASSEEYERYVSLSVLETPVR